MVFVNARAHDFVTICSRLSQRLDKYQRGRALNPAVRRRSAQRQPGAAPTSALLDTGAANLVLIAGYLTDWRIMTTAQLRPIAPQKLHFSENLSVWVSDAQCRLVVSQPALDPTLWNTYLQGALRAYSKHGVECTLDLDAISDGSDTQLFFAAIDIGGDVVGGARVIGPLRSADDSHAVVEWAGNPGLSAVRKMINDRAPFGVVEVKSGWVNSDAQRSDAIAAALARALPLSMSLLGVQFVMGTAAAHALDRWRSSGGVIAARIPAAAYPDERYRTKMIWWDRRTLANHAEPKQLSRMLVESRKLLRDVEALSATTAATAGAEQ